MNIMIDKIDFKDKELICADCGLKFTFTQDEQRFFWSKGLAEPKRCKPCRMLRRRTINGETERLMEGYDGQRTR